MDYQDLTLLTAFLLIYSVFAGRFESRWVHGAFMFMLVGIALGPLGLNLLHLSIRGEGISFVAEITLAIVLFTDAANVNLKVLSANNWMPSRLLLIGLPLCLLAGWGFGVLLFPDTPILELAILAAVLAPTDAALGKAVITNTSVPARIREALNIESGLNDGICVPVLFILLALWAPEKLHQSTLEHATLVILEEIGLGFLVGTSLAFTTGVLMRISARHHWDLRTWNYLTYLGLAVLSFSLAQLMGGSGFIAAFICGLCAGYQLKKHKHAYLESNEGYADLLSLIVWILFGAIIITNTLDYFSWKTWTYAIASLTVIRMLPVWISLLGTDLSTEARLFIGWFGPRGLASIVFAVIVMEYELVAKTEVIATVVNTILLSVVLHGLTANVWVKHLKRRLAKQATS